MPLLGAIVRSPKAEGDTSMGVAGAVENLEYAVDDLPPLISVVAHSPKADDDVLDRLARSVGSLDIPSSEKKKVAEVDIEEMIFYIWKSACVLTLVLVANSFYICVLAADPGSRH